MYSVRIQLENGYLDVKDSAPFPLNFGVGDIRDISQKSGAFSKTLTLIGNANNHELLGHYYDVNLVEGTFNINALTECTVVQNGIPILENAYIQLLSVNKVQTNDAYEQSIEYSVLVKDQTSTFFSKLDNKELKDIDYSDMNHTLNSAAITGSFNNTVADGYKYSMGWTGDIYYTLKEFNPAIYAKIYFDRIFAASGFNYTWSSLSACNFDKCIIPYNGDVVTADYSAYDVNATHAADTISIVQTAGTNVSFVETLTSFTEVLDTQNIFTPLTGVYTVPFDVSAGQSLSFNIDIAGTIDLVNATGSTKYLVDMFSSPTTVGYTYRLILSAYRSNNLTNPISVLGGINFRAEGSIANGTTNLDTFSGTYTIPVSNVVAGETVIIKAGIQVTQTGGSSLKWKSVNNTTPSGYVIITPELSYTSFDMTVIASSNVLASGMTIDMNKFVPNKIKQKDFIKSIFTMFNIYAEPDENTPNTLVLKTRDEYYDSGTERNWSGKLAKDKEQVLQFLPDISAKKLILTYKQDSDDTNKIYYDTTREVYGQAEYIFENEYVKGIDVKELIFSPTPIGKTVFGAYVPMVAGSSPKNNIRILLDNGEQTCGAWTLEVNYNTSTTGITTYPQLHHFNDALNPTFDLNFALCDFLFYGGYEITNNGLYNTFWRRTINQINTGKMLTAEFNLNEVDIQQMRLNDKIYIDNSWWIINKIIDYNANNRQLTKVELLSTDDEIDFVPFITRRPTKPNATDYASATQGVNQTITNNNNTIVHGADVIIKGRGNIVVGGVKAMIEGDNGIVNEDGIYKFVDGSNVWGENFANADLNFIGNRSHNTAGFNLEITTDNGIFGEGYVLVYPTDASIGVSGTSFNAVSNQAAISINGVNRVEALTNTLRLNQSIEFSYTAKTGTYTITNNDYLINCTSNTFTVTLPTAVSITGRTYIIKNSGSGVITLEGDGTETIDGALNFTLTQYVSVTVVSDGANWIITAVN